LLEALGAKGKGGEVEMVGEISENARANKYLVIDT
jgi:hypothetical protein